MDADTVVVGFWKNFKSRIFYYVFMFVLDERGVTQQRQIIHSVKGLYTVYIRTK